ncbi:MAG: T9SS type A sorting domain-containing protein [Chitinophagales bacterium]
MKKILLYITTICLCCNAFSQSYDNNWVFGDSAGLNFSSGEPEPFVSGIMTYEACASISDENGNLLFCTNGEKVWNRDNAIMQNGDSLDIGKIYTPYGSSITQGVIIIQRPNTSFYYIFQIQNYIIDNNYGIEYTIVDISQDDGKGAVTDKNINLFTTDIGEKMTAVKNANGRDWWLIFLKWDELADDYFDLQFTRFLISPAGIEGPFYQDFGPDSHPDDIDQKWGQMVFSGNGSKMAYTRIDDVLIYTFDRCSGEFTDYYFINNIDNISTYGCSFSPDGNKLYVNGVCTKDLYQYCLNCDGIPVDSTKQLVYHGPPGSYCLMQHMLGPDGKIYVASCYNILPNDIFSPINQNLCVINNPNEVYPLCDFDTNTVSLGTRRVIAGLPNMVNYNLGPLVGSGCDTLGTSVQNMEASPAITVYPNPAAEQIIIDMGADPTGTSMLILTNTMGQMVYSTVLNKRKTQIDISPLPEGIYAWSVIISGEHIAAGQVLKLRP